MKDIRPMTVAGMFYPRSPEALRDMIRGFLDQVEAPAMTDAKALIVPHAGLIYSGQTAAYAYKAIEKHSYDTIVIIGPKHRSSDAGGTSIYCRGGFQTPLGILKVDEDFSMQILSGTPNAYDDPVSHHDEHSLEVQLPFLQLVQPKTRIVPIVMGDYSLKACDGLATGIANVLNQKDCKKVLILASTDLSHYHDEVTAKKMDDIAIAHIQRIDPQALHRESHRRSKCELCGLGPVYVVLSVMQKIKANNCHILNYSHSGDVSGDNDHVVGYVSAVLQ